MSDRHDLARVFALLKLLLGELGSAKSAADDDIRDGWVVGDRNSATLPDGKVVGQVTLNKGRTSAVIADEAAYKAWVKQTHPEALITETRTYVSAIFTERLKSAARKLGTPVDAETGEIVPGMEVTEGEPYPSIRLAENARELIAEAWQDGSLTELVSGLLAIEGGES